MNLSFKQYRGIDLTIMAVLLAVSEAVVAFAETKWFPEQLIMLSPTLAIVCIVMMRWDGYAVIHAAIGGFVFCLASGASAQQFAVYCAGNCGVLAALVFFKIFDKKKVRDKFYLTLVFVLIAFCGLQLGRWAVSLVFGGEVSDIVMFMAGDCISLLFAAVVVLISRRMDGLFEDQKAYLLRVNEEKEREREERENSNNGY